MKHVLCYGDSNTYGFTPDWRGRYPRAVRWPGALQALLGADWYVEEDGLVGRTTAFPDADRYGRSAMDFLPVAIEAARPLDYLILMLGTNDCKTAKNSAAASAAAGMERLVRLAQSMLPAETRILVISPPPIRPQAIARDPDFAPSALAVMGGLAPLHREIARRLGCLYLEAGTVAQTSDEDGEHLDAAGHAALARAVAVLLSADAQG